MTDTIDPISQIFEEVKSSQDDNSLELFNKGEIDLRTDLIPREQVLTTAIIVENSLINSVLPGFGLYDYFINTFMRTKVSLDRKSRSEFVQVNMKNTMDRDLARVSNLKNLTESRQ